MKCPHCGKDTDDRLVVETGDNELWSRSILQAGLRIGQHADIGPVIRSSEQIAHSKWFKVCDECGERSCEGCNMLVEP